jgi:hypothetical protein
LDKALAVVIFMKMAIFAELDEAPKCHLCHFAEAKGERE